MAASRLLAPRFLMRRILPFLLLFLCAVSVSAGDEKATEAQIRALKKEIGALQSRLDQREGKASSLLAALKKSETAIGRISKQIRALDQQLSRLGNHAGTLEERKQALQAELAQRAVRIEEQLRLQYKRGSQPWLQVLLTQRDPEILSRMMRYFSQVNAELARQLQQFRERLASLNATESELSDTEQQMVLKRRQLKLEAGELEQQQSERKGTLAALKKSIGSDKQRLDRLLADRSRLESLLKELQRSIEKVSLARDGQSFRSLKGKLDWPVKGAVKRNFGSVSDNIRYDGIWIASQTGRTVKAVHHGQVVFSDWLRGYGLVLIIDHGGRYLSLYGYNETLQRDVGDWVSAGDTIATVGSSGGREDPGLYFAIRYKGKATNPKRWLTR